jgi:AraC family transcriptional regulator
MITKRFYNVRLSSDIVVRFMGAFADEEPVMEWTQAVEQWEGMLFHDSVMLTVNGEVLDIKPWSFVVIPPGSKCRIDWTGEPHYIYVYFGFRCLTDEGFFRALPQVTELGSQGPFWDMQLRKGIANLRSCNDQMVTAARALIWSVTEEAELKKRNVFVVEAERLISEDEDFSLKISELAKAVGISQSQLCRLFALEHGATPKQFISALQARRAQEMLTTTTLPIKEIAKACGCPNLHHFNRFVRSHIGASPRDVRNHRVPKDIFRIETFRVQLED